MTYRDQAATLDERHRTLRQALDENRAQSTALTAEEAALHHELAALHSKLEATRRTKRQLPLANVLIASPCDVPWTSMVGDERVRHCASCKKDVHNLSAMTRDEIDAFLASQVEGSCGLLPCISLFQRADGTVLTADCPVGVRRRRSRSIFAVTFGVGATALVAFTALAVLLHPQPSEEGCSLRKPQPTTYVPVGSSALTAAAVPFGYVSMATQVGARVYEGDQLLGVGPLAFSAAVGTHVYRVDQANAPPQTLTVVVREHEIATVNALPPPVMAAGGISAMPPRMKKGGLDGL